MLIHRDGRVEDVKVRQESGDAWLDSAAVAAIGDAQPLPPPPRELLNTLGVVRFDLGFRVYREQYPATGAEDERRDPFAVIFAAPDYSRMGKGDPPSTKAVIRSHEGKVKHCYDQQLTIDPRLEGKLTLRFIISASGEVAAPVVVMSTGLNRPLEECLLDLALQWRFPAPKGGRVVVHYPFSFEPATPQEQPSVSGAGHAVAAESPINANDPVEVLKGQIVVTRERLAPSFRSSSTFLEAILKSKVEDIPSVEDVAHRRRIWHIEFVGFFAQPIDAHTVAVKFSEITDGGNRHVASDTQYTREARSRLFSSWIDLSSDVFVAGNRYLMTIDSDQGTLASTTLRLLR